MARGLPVIVVPEIFFMRLYLFKTLQLFTAGSTRNALLRSDCARNWVVGVLHSDIGGKSSVVVASISREHARDRGRGVVGTGERAAEGG